MKRYLSVGMALTLLIAMMLGGSVLTGSAAAAGFALDCDSADGWQTDVNQGKLAPFSEAGTVDTTDKKEGTGCLSEVAVPEAFLGASVNFVWTSDEAVDSGLTVDNAVLKMWVYASNDTAFNMAAKIQIGSGGQPDVDEYEFILGDNGSQQAICTHYGLIKEGWNEISWNLSDAVVKGNPDLSAINFFKVYSLIMPVGSVVKIDDVRLVSADDQEPPADDTTDTTDSPNTGDTDLVVALCVAAAALPVMVLCQVRRKTSR